MNRLKNYINLLLEEIENEDIFVFRDWLIEFLSQKGYQEQEYEANGELLFEKMINNNLKIVIHTGLSFRELEKFIGSEDSPPAMDFAVFQRKNNLWLANQNLDFSFEWEKINNLKRITNVVKLLVQKTEKFAEALTV